MLTTGNNYSPDDRGGFHGTLTPLGQAGVTVSDGDIVLDSVTLTENCCDRKFGFGAFISAQLDMTIKLGGEHDLQSPLLTRAQLDLSRKFFDGDDIETADIPLGHFFIDDSTVKRTKTSAAFTAYDAAVWFDRPVPENAELTDVTPYELIEYACETVSDCLTDTFGEGYTVTMEQTASDISSYPNAGYTFSWKHSSSEQLTLRDMVCTALGIMGAWGRINRFGRFEIHRFDLSSAVYTINSSNAVKRSISDSYTRITGVSCGNIQYGTSEQLYSIERNLLINSVPETNRGYIVSALGGSNKVTGFDIYTSDVSWFGDLSLEAGDCIAYSENGTVHKIIAMENIWKPHGLCTVRAFGVNSESGTVSSDDSMGNGGISAGEVAYIKTNIVVPEVDGMEFRTDRKINARLDRLSLKKLTAEEYEELVEAEETDPNTIYTVVGEDPVTGEPTVEQYLGDMHISEGGGGDDGIPYPAEMIYVLDTACFGFAASCSLQSVSAGAAWVEGSWDRQSVEVSGETKEIVVPVSNDRAQRTTIYPDSDYLYFDIESDEYLSYTGYCVDSGGYYVGTVSGYTKLRTTPQIKASARWIAISGLPAGTVAVHLWAGRDYGTAVRGDTVYYLG